MTADYKPVQDALTAGADPAMLCATCPWDRYCVTPPTMTRAEVDAQIQQASQMDSEHRAKARPHGPDAGLPVATLMTAIAYGGRDVMGQLCPVFSLRLRSGKGRDLADTVKSTMRDWDDQS